MKKILIYTFLLGVSTLLILFLLLRFGGYIFLDREMNEEIVKEIKAAPPLPDRFYELYEVIYPKSLSTGLTENYIRSIISKEFRIQEIPLYRASYIGSDGYWLGNPIPYRYYIEDHTSQKECLNSVAFRTDFLYNNIGVYQASQFYFQKEFEDLNDKEMTTLIIMMENPSFYNPIRRPEKVKEKVKDALEKFYERLEYL